MRAAKVQSCSPVSGGRTIRLCSFWPSDADLSTPLRPPVDTGAGDRGGASAKFPVVSETVGCRKGVDSVVLRKGGIEFEDADKRSAAPNFAPFRQKSLGDCTRPLLPTQGWLTGLTKNGHVPKGAVLGEHPVVSGQRQLSERERESARALLGTTVHKGGSRAAPAVRTPHHHALSCFSA